MIVFVRALTLVCLLLALARVRAGYLGFVALALLSFGARVGFHLDPHRCELLVGPALALHSFRNYPHIVLCALFFLLTRWQLRGPQASGWAALATLAMGALVEIAEGVSGSGHCRLRDLLPDGAGALLGWVACAAGCTLIRAARRPRMASARTR